MIDHGLNLICFGNIGLNGTGTTARFLDFVRHQLTTRAIVIRNDDCCALNREQSCCRRANTRRRACDNRYFSVQLAHVI